MFDVGNNNVNRSGSHKTRKKNWFSKLSVEDKKKLSIIIAIALIILLFISLYFKKQNENFNNIKVNKNNYLVYTKMDNKKSSYHISIPYINIKSSVADSINEDIDLFVSDFIEGKSTILYEYDINGIILSLVIKVVDYETNYAPQVYFRSYNFNLSTLELISDDSLLSFYGVDYSTIEEIVELQFRNYYDRILNDDYYVEQECNYSCFLNYRGVDEYLDGIAYYVKDGNLVGYKPFIFNSIFGEEKSFTDDDFKILLVERSKE